MCQDTQVRLGPSVHTHDRPPPPIYIHTHAKKTEKEGRRTDLPEGEGLEGELTGDVLLLEQLLVEGPQLEVVARVAVCVLVFCSGGGGGC